jgi:hypothetical protein
MDRRDVRSIGLRSAVTMFASDERAQIAALEDSAREPLRLPSIDEVEAELRELDARLQQDPESAREQLRRWLRDGSIQIGPREDGELVAEGARGQGTEVFQPVITCEWRIAGSTPASPYR